MTYLYDQHAVGGPCDRHNHGLNDDIVQDPRDGNSGPWSGRNDPNREMELHRERITRLTNGPDTRLFRGRISHNLFSMVDGAASVADLAAVEMLAAAVQQEMPTDTLYASIVIDLETGLSAEMIADMIALAPYPYGCNVVIGRGSYFGIVETSFTITYQGPTAGMVRILAELRDVGCEMVHHNRAEMETEYIDLTEMAI